jgi:hypothetical protein
MKSNNNRNNNFTGGHRLFGIAMMGLVAAISASLIVPSQMLLQGADAQRADTYRVRFIQVKVLNTHEGFLSGDGEFKLWGGANGKQIFLDTCTPAPGKFDCDGRMNDVSKNEVVKLPASKYVDVVVPRGGILNIGAYGFEEDWGGWVKTTPPAWAQRYCNIVSSICNYWDITSRAANWIGDTLNANDKLGVVEIAYKVPNYPQGSITVTSKTRDYQLTFSIEKIGGIVLSPPLTRQ